MFYAVLVLLCAVFAAVFIRFEHDKKYVPAVIFKGLASLMFVMIGLRACGYDFSHAVAIGLLLGCIADVLLNLRFVFEKIGQKVFLVGILVFLAGHVMYLIWLVRNATLVWLWLAIGVLGTFFLLRWIFARITAKKVFKIFGVFYLGTIMLMTCTALGAVITAFSLRNLIFAAGSLLFLASDVVLILNTFGSETKFLLRVTNLSLYYAAQLLIALSLLA